MDLILVSPVLNSILYKCLLIIALIISYITLFLITLLVLLGEYVITMCKVSFTARQKPDELNLEFLKEGKKQEGPSKTIPLI